MAEEKKSGPQGPVVIRKGHVKPPPPGAKIEEPQVEVLGPASAEKKERADPRPLWQRLAEEKSGGARRGPGGPGGGGSGGGAPGGGPRRGPPRGDRPRERDRGERRPR